MKSEKKAKEADPQKSKVRIPITLLFALLIGLLLFIVFSKWAYDDPFITYRYARNLSQGLGFVYNPEEKVLSTTTPLFTLILASLYPISINLPLTANFIGIISLVAGGLILWNMGNLWGSPLVGWTGLFLYPTFHLLTISLSSEMPLYITFCLGALLFFGRKQFLLAAVFGGLATLTRPDGVLVPLLLTATYLFQERRLPPASANLLFLCLTTPWFLFAWFYFGSPLPTTLFTKQHQALLPVSPGFLSGFQTMISWYTGIWQYLLATIMALVGVIVIFWQRRAFLLLFLWSLLFIISYSLLGVGRYFWYYTPLVPTFIILVGLGFEILSCPGKSQNKKSSFLSWAFRLPGYLAWGSILLLMVFQIQNLLLTKNYQDPRFPIYQAIGVWINENTPVDASVGALEVGIIGYYAQRPMVDFAGLIQPQVAAQLTPQTTYEDAAIWAIKNYQPDYLVLHAGAFPNLEKDYVLQNCHLVQEFQGSDYGYSAQMNIYSCQNT